ncbi:hypothetical protein LEP1GSC082_1868 [Leptospira kirschneri str. H2]|uniref:Uncharacterized protein n=2 Tax=Leptospira kirschneri TaxID=29507 RepID=M6F6E7_9LEPT|nr:hypothetical protein LEP1GSC081_0834 [Leptospira kirschneri str. H1]EKO60626.1 hypothetical protein LEP1GSC082_2658 [Leptospira kirschneri str. H2]EMK24368.1 hypothetical protein LEP1GSC008_4190 [Leptospira kirschneri serovar Bulgarica str. Nikolaevo]EKO14249.1 hypothetical protein LEP1GSC081_0818 [Leptospira kirschneri str. H1]EKO15136.1 hypothetical protein LEP1GSC081_4419 [Leptospira kirschneri str. H1]
MNELSTTLFTKALETQRLASTVARSNSAQRFPKGRVVGSSYWYFMKIESDSVVSQ